MPEAYFPLHFDAEGRSPFPVEREAIIAALQGNGEPVTDLWILSYGWNNDEAAGAASYRDWVRQLRERMAIDMHDPGFNPAFVGIFWPSKAWSDALPRPSQASAGPTPGSAADADRGDWAPDENRAAGGSQAPVWGGRMPELGGGRPPESTDGPPPAPGGAVRACFVEDFRAAFQHGPRSASYEEDFGRLYDLLSKPAPLSEADIRAFVETLWPYSVDDPHADPSEQGSLVSNSEVAERTLVSELGPGGREGSRLRSGLLAPFRAFTFWTMKGRAGLVGERGVAPFLHAVRALRGDSVGTPRLHLLGHSFGAKLVTAAVYGLADAQQSGLPVVDTLVLAQGAFSRFSFSPDITIDPGRAGRYAPVVARALVAHPIVVIFSRHDRANVDLYPMGMYLGVTSPLYELGERFGAIGAYGASDLEPELCRAIVLRSLEAQEPWGALEGVRCLNVDAQEIVKDMAREPIAGAHGDINHPELFQLALAVSRGQSA